METYPREVQIYVNEDGKAPFLDWLRSLRNQKAKDQIRARITRLRLGLL